MIALQSAIRVFSQRLNIPLISARNVLLFVPPSAGKSYLSAALGLALVESGRRVLFQRTTERVQRLQVARRELALESAIAKLDRYDLLILDDLGNVSKDEAERRGVTTAIKRELKRRAAVEPVIGHLKNDHRMDRNSLIGSHGDAANAMLAAVGYNFRHLAAWLRQPLRTLLLIPPAHRSNPEAAPIL